MKRRNKKHKKSEETLADIHLEMYKEAMRLERERRKERDFFHHMIDLHIEVSFHV